MTPPALRVPEIVPDVNVRALPLSALEGFVLSRVDGRSNIADLASMTGLSDDHVTTIVARLEQLGAVRIRAGGTSVPPQRSHGQGHDAHGHDAHGHDAHARRRAARSGQPPRRMMSEGTISQAAPEFRQSQRPFTSENAGRIGSSLPPQGTPRSTPASDRPPSLGSERPGAPASERPAPRAPRNKALVPPALSSPPAETAAAPLYDPHELEEEVDIPLERRRQILELYYSIHELDLYELLDVPYDANKRVIRDAYFRLSRVFHPDTLFRKSLGSFKPKMEGVFKHLTEAYDTLSKKKSRTEYDRYLRATKSTQMAERVMRQQAAQLRADQERAREQEEPSPFPERLSPRPINPIRSDVPPGPPVRSEPAPRHRPAGPGAPHQHEMSDEARRLARQVIERRLRGVLPKTAALANQAQARPSDPPRTNTDPHELVRRLAKTLQDVSKITGTNDQLTRHLKASQTAFARGNLQEATFQMRRALSIAPDRPDLQFEHDRLSKLLSGKLAEDYETQASYEQQMGKWASAALAWSKVCEGRPDSLDAHLKAAQCMLKAGADLRGAQKYAQQAVLLAPGDVECRTVLAQIYLTIGLKLNAKRELDAALKLDPNNEMVKNLLGEASV